jgi:hypothetical protein
MNLPLPHTKFVNSMADFGIFAGIVAAMVDGFVPTLTLLINLATIVGHPTVTTGIIVVPTAADLQTRIDTMMATFVGNIAVATSIITFVVVGRPVRVLGPLITTLDQCPQCPLSIKDRCLFGPLHPNNHTRSCLSWTPLTHFLVQARQHCTSLHRSTYMSLSICLITQYYKQPVILD